MLILALLLLTEFQKPTISGEVERISGSFPIRIILKNQSQEIILFENQIKLEKGNLIEVCGSTQSEHEIIANKIVCLNC